jgi:isopentenyldiphosphate isomerase
MQDMEDAVISTILREWEIDTSHVDRRTLQYCGKVYYKADDLLSKYHEHEVCHAYALTITEEPKFRQEFAYGMSVVPEEVLFNINSTLQLAFAPWVKPILPLFQQLKNNDEQ